MTFMLFFVGTGCSGAAKEEISVVQVPGVSADEIRLGSSLALIGHASFL
jgi:hypothetical protein